MVRRRRGDEFLETRIIPERIEHWIESEQRRRGRESCPKSFRSIVSARALMASTRQCLLNQFADLSVCANQNNFHKNFTFGVKVLAS